MSQGKRKSTSSQKGQNLKILNLALLALYVILVVSWIFIMFAYNILAFLYVNAIISGVLILFGILMAVLIWKNKGRVVITLILIISLLIGSVGLYGVKKVIDLSDSINTTANYSELEMSIVVPVDSEITDISQLTTVLAPTGNDANNIQEFIDDIARTQGKELTVEATSSYLAAYQSLLKGETKAMVLNSVFESIIANEDVDYASKIKKLYTYKISKTIENANQEKQNSTAFNVYISGIDTYGPVSSVSRSDVNIIMTVNRDTKKVLLTTTPRDAYVPIADGGANQPDKLTHAGIYGVDASIHTLENLYGIDINYYARLNFTSFLKLIDLLGGIEVYNDQEFTSLHGNYHFAVGDVHLNSEQALGFVRERYSLNAGDNDRGKNQEKVIAAVIKKLTTTDTLKNYNAIISGLQDSIQTDMPLATMMNLVNTQLESGGSYTVTSQALEGTGTMGLPSYAMPEANLYMMEINQDSLTNVKAAITKVMEGQ